MPLSCGGSQKISHTGPQACILEAQNIEAVALWIGWEWRSSV